MASRGRANYGKRITLFRSNFSKRCRQSKSRMARIVDIQFDPKVLHIFSPIVLRMIKNGINGWEDLVPPYVDNVIKDKKLFGYKKTITSKEEV